MKFGVYAEKGMLDPKYALKSLAKLKTKFYLRFKTYL